MINKYPLIILIIINISPLLKSQAEESFIHISLKLTNNFIENDFHEYWKPKPGLNSEFSFDYSVGELGVGLGFMRFDKNIESTKGFYGLDYYFLYKHLPKLTECLDLILKFNVGIYEFRFDDDGTLQSSAERVEREFAIKIESGLSYEFYNLWKAELTTSYSHIYTNKKIELIYFNLGIVKSFSTPEWLKEFLE
jgi:hypothetical protein